MHAFQFAKVQHLSLASCSTKVSIIDRLEVGCLSQDPQLEALLAWHDNTSYTTLHYKMKKTLTVHAMEIMGVGIKVKYYEQS